MEIKFFVKNPYKHTIMLPPYKIIIEPKGEVEINGDFARLIMRQLEVRRITLERGKEINNVNYREFVENSESIKQREREERKTLKSLK